MSRGILGLAIALLLGACAPTPEAPTEPAAETVAALATLEDRIGELEADLEIEIGDRAKIADRLDGLSDKLERALGRLREALSKVRAGSAGAQDSAASALANAQSAASQLSVLEERYEYHLRQDHGGGG